MGWKVREFDIINVPQIKEAFMYEILSNLNFWYALVLSVLFLAMNKFLTKDFDGLLEYIVSFAISVTCILFAQNTWQNGAYGAGVFSFLVSLWLITIWSKAVVTKLSTAVRLYQEIVNM